MKIFSLIFDYNITKMQQTGRPWAETAYKNKDFIFTYSAASIATFLHHNPHLPYEILTDDVNLLDEKLSAYNVDKSNLSIVDATALINEWTQHWYCFWPLIQAFDYQLKNNDRGVLKLDNDLTCLKPIDDLLKHEGAIVWKKERLCANGKDYWGEKFAAQRAFGTDQFYIYNTGTWGLTKMWHNSAKIIPKYCEQLIEIDISAVSRFPESPGVKSAVFNTSDQVANCYYIEKNSVPVLESSNWFEHHCYSHEAKSECIKMANFLTKKRR